MKILVALAWFVLTIIGNALLHSWALSKLWLWFAAAQYGAGPSMAAWFGLAAIARLVLNRDDWTKSKDDDVDLAKLAWMTIGSWAGVLLVLGLSWLCGYSVGWVA